MAEKVGDEEGRWRREGQEVKMASLRGFQRPKRVGRKLGIRQRDPRKTMTGRKKMRRDGLCAMTEAWRAVCSSYQVQVLIWYWR